VFLIVSVFSPFQETPAFLQIIFLPNILQIIRLLKLYCSLKSFPLFMFYMPNFHLTPRALQFGLHIQTAMVHIQEFFL